MPTAAQLLAAARSEIGYTESPPRSNRNKFAREAGHANGQPWCASYAEAITNRVGLVIPNPSPFTPWMADGFRDAGRWSREPVVGSLAFFDFPDNVYRIQHVGIVEAATSSRVTTIDGNTSSGPGGSEANGGGVFRRERSRSVVVGYGLLSFTSTPPAPRPPTPQEKPVPHQPTDVTKTTGGWLVEVTLDADGNGAVGPMDRVPWADFASVVQHGPFPHEDGYQRAKPGQAQFRAQERKGHLLVVVYGKPRQRVAFHVRTKSVR